VRSRMFVGASELLEVDCGNGPLLKVRVSGHYDGGETVVLEISPDRLIPLTA